MLNTVIREQGQTRLQFEDLSIALEILQTHIQGLREDVKTAESLEHLEFPFVRKIPSRTASGAHTTIFQFTEYTLPNARLIHDRLQEKLGWESRLNIFSSPPHADAFPEHQDSYDSLIFQISGEKKWTVRGGDGSLETTVLRCGQSLFIPKGVLHEVRGNEQHSMHITLAIRQTDSPSPRPHLRRDLQPLSAGPIEFETLKRWAGLGPSSISLMNLRNGQAVDWSLISRRISIGDGRTAQEVSADVDWSSIEEHLRDGEHELTVQKPWRFFSGLPTLPGLAIRIQFDPKWPSWSYQLEALSP